MTAGRQMHHFLNTEFSIDSTVYTRLFSQYGVAHNCLAGRRKGY